MSKNKHSQPSVHTAYSGLNGSGKTYSVVQNVVVPALERGRAIATNLIFKDALFELYPDAKIVVFEESDFVDDNGVIDFNYFMSDKFSECDLFIFDECQNYFGTELTASKIPKTFKAFLTKMRHRKVNGRSSLAVYIAPDLNQVTKFIRDLVSITYRTIKMDKMGLPNVYHVQVWDGAVTGQRPSGQPSRNTKGTYKQSIFDLYKSQTGGDDDDDDFDMEHALEETLDARSNFMVPLIRKVIVGVFILGLAYYFMADFFYSSELAGNISPKNETITASNPIASVVTPEPDFKFQPDFYIVSFIVSKTTDFLLEDLITHDQYSRSDLEAMGYNFTINSECNINLKIDKNELKANCPPVYLASSD